jgi:hypothetical protein
VSRRNSGLLLATLLFAGSTILRAQPASTPSQTVPAQSKPEVRFDFVRAGLPVPQYTIEVRSDGSGSYTAEDKSAGAPQHIARDLTLSPATTKRIFTLALAVHPDGCASKAKNIADSGTKTLTYTAPGATSSCIYNYTEIKDLQSITDIFQGIAETLDLGRRLDFLRRFDRLGLDDAIAFLSQEIASGRALEIGTIAPSLRAIVADAAVMQRVRTKAVALLAQMPAEDSSR